MKTVLALIFFLPFLICSQEKCLTTNDIANFGDKSLTEIQLLLKGKEWDYKGELSSNPTGKKDLNYDVIHKWEKASKDNVAEFILFKEGSFTKAIFVNFENKVSPCEKSLFGEFGPPPSEENQTLERNSPRMQMMMNDFLIYFLIDYNSNNRIVSAHFDHETSIDIPAKPIQEKSYGDPIVEYPDIVAQFPGGADEMKRFVNKNLKYPEISREMADQGRVYAQFVVNEDGTIEQVKILRGVSRDIDNETIRLIKSMPNWTPGESQGKLVRTRVRIPINFILTVEGK